MSLKPYLETLIAGERHLLDPGPFGSLGTGPGYAIAAKVAFPERRVGLVFGDGGFGPFLAQLPTEEGAGG